MAGKLPATGWKTNLRKKVDTIMLAFRNKLLAGGKPTEDVNELLIRLMK